MSKKALSKKQQATRNKLLQAGQTMTNEAGYASLTMNGVAELANVSRITAYNYFSGKDHLLAAIVSEQLKEFEKSFISSNGSTISPCTQLSQSLCRLIDFLYASPNLLSAFIISSNVVNQHSVNLATYVTNMTAELLKESKSLNPIESQTLALHMGFQTHSIIINLASGEVSLNEAKQYTADAVELLWRALSQSETDNHVSTSDFVE